MRGCGRRQLHLHLLLPLRRMLRRVAGCCGPGPVPLACAAASRAGWEDSCAGSTRCKLCKFPSLQHSPALAALAALAADEWREAFRGAISKLELQRTGSGRSVSSDYQVRRGACRVFCVG